MKKEDFKILSDKEHVLLRKDMYIGSASLEEKSMFLNYEYKTVRFVPGLFKIINELIDNAVDENIRTDGKYANKIQITMSEHSLTVRDNGRGIPVEKIVDENNEKIYRPIAAWCKTKAGSNFNNDDERITGGMFGVGGSVTNIFSKKFIGETCDGSNKLRVECSNNATIDSVKVTKSSKRYTEVTSFPDFERFDVEKFDETMFELVKDRINNLSIAFPLIEFKFNGNIINAGSARTFVQKFDDNAIVINDENIVLGVMPSPSTELRFHTIVNGLILYNGGTHIDYVLDSIISTLREGIKKKHKFDITPGQIKSHLQLVLILRKFKNIKVDSQTKEILKNTKSEIASHIGHVDYEKLAKQILKTDAIILPIIETQLAKQAWLEAKEERDKKKKVKNIKVPKHIPASSKNPNQKTLFIGEGDSAVGPFVSVRNPVTQGAIPLRGVVMNTYGEKPKEILSNEELSQLMAVIGLELGKPANNLNYGTIALMTDEDIDGGAIRGLLINFLYNWPELFDRGCVKILHSPRYILRGKKDSHYFYTKDELDSFTGSTKGYDLAYIKGLGTLRMKEYKDVITNPVFETVVIDDPNMFELMYGKNILARKEFMMK